MSTPASTSAGSREGSAWNTNCLSRGSPVYPTALSRLTTGASAAASVGATAASGFSPRASTSRTGDSPYTSPPNARVTGRGASVVVVGVARVVDVVLVDVLDVLLV